MFKNTNTTARIQKKPIRRINSQGEFMYTIKKYEYNSIIKSMLRKEKR